MTRDYLRPRRGPPADLLAQQRADRAREAGLPEPVPSLDSIRNGWHDPFPDMSSYFSNYFQSGTFQGLPRPFPISDRFIARMEPPPELVRIETPTDTVREQRPEGFDIPEAMQDTDFPFRDTQASRDLLNTMQNAILRSMEGDGRTRRIMANQTDPIRAIPTPLHGARGVPLGEVEHDIGDMRQRAVGAAGGTVRDALRTAEQATQTRLGAIQGAGGATISARDFYVTEGPGMQIGNRRAWENAPAIRMGLDENAALLNTIPRNPPWNHGEINTTTNHIPPGLEENYRNAPYQPQTGRLSEEYQNYKINIQEIIKSELDMETSIFLDGDNVVFSVNLKLKGKTFSKSQVSFPRSEICPTS